jgi:hypothetical protein
MKPRGKKTCCDELEGRESGRNTSNKKKKKKKKKTILSEFAVQLPLDVI